MPTRRSFLAATGAAALHAQARKPNIVWIMADDLGYADIGCYGQKIIRTPNIDRLASEGTRFTDAYAGCTVCAPSRSVLLTGLHMGHTPIRSNPGGVPLLAEERTVGEMLKSAGYATGCFGKWGLGDIGTDGVPWKHGFDEFAGFLHQAHAHFQYPRFIYSNDRELPLKGNVDGARVTFANDVVAERGLAFLKQNKDKPFFGYFPFTVPHLELLAPADSMAPYRHLPEPVPYRSKRYANQDAPRAAYAGMVSRLDRYVGQILDTLKQTGRERDTLVFFTSDNGGATRLWKEDYFSSHASFRGHKQNFYEGGIRVPMIARWPDRVPAGKTCDFAWMFEDALPTFAEVAGVKPPAGIDGMSVLPTLTGRAQKPHEFLYWEQPRYDGKTATFQNEIPMQAIRMGNWKAVRPVAGGPVELYDLAKDIGETKNISTENVSVVDKLSAKMAAEHKPPRPQKELPHPWWEARS